MAVAPGKAKGSFPGTTAWKMLKLWLWVGSSAGTGLAWAALELDPSSS